MYFNKTKQKFSKSHNNHTNVQQIVNIRLEIMCIFFIVYNYLKMYDVK